MSITSRIDAITEIPEAYRSATPPCPRSVKIELTARCDFKCWFCATGAKLRKTGDMDWSLLEKLLPDMREAGVEELGLFYLGESFLRRDLEDVVEYVKIILGYPYVFLTTNGRLATPGRVEACMLAGLDSLKFSFNWADAEQMRDGARVDAFDTVVANIKAARAARDRVERDFGHRCGLYASSILYDGEQQERMKAAVETIRPFVDEHYWLPLYSQAGLLRQGFGGQGPSEGLAMRSSKSVAGNIGRVGALREPLPCWALFTEGHVTFDGKLSACCFDHDGRFDMGDLTKMGFMEAWHSERFQALRAANLAKDVTGTACEACVAYA